MVKRLIKWFLLLGIEEQKYQPLPFRGFKPLDRETLVSQAKLQDRVFLNIPITTTGDDLLSLVSEAYHPEDMERIKRLIKGIDRQLGDGENYFCSYSSDRQNIGALWPFSESSANNIVSIRGFRDPYPEINALVCLPKIRILRVEGTSVYVEVEEPSLEILSGSVSFRDIIGRGCGGLGWEGFLKTNDGMIIQEYARIHGGGHIQQEVHDSQVFGDVQFRRSISPEEIHYANLKDAMQKGLDVYRFIGGYYDGKEELIRKRMETLLGNTPS